jgi:hypothetical protein
MFVLAFHVKNMTGFLLYKEGEQFLHIAIHVVISPVYKPSMGNHKMADCMEIRYL